MTKEKSSGRQGAEGEPPRTFDDDERAKIAAAPTPPEAWIIHELIREDGEREIRRTLSSLIWSGFGAGLSMGFSFLGLALIRGGLPKADWAHLVSGFGYTIGFLIAVLGRQQLFTESTLTAMLPFLARRDRSTLVAMVRLWTTVLLANLVGTIAFALLISYPHLFEERIADALAEIGPEVMRDPFVPTMLKAVLSGWLIALMVWLLPGAGPARLLLIVVLTYFVAIGAFPHVVASSAEVAYAVINGRATVSDYVLRFLVPTLIGNTLGGASLVALLNHAPVRDEIPGHDEERKGRRGEGGRSGA